MANKLAELGYPFTYESMTLKYTVPEKARKYTPDFELTKDCFIEVKGKLDLATRQKMVYIRQQYPGMKMILCFGKPGNFLYRGSKTTYADWADKNGFYWCDPSTLSILLEDLCSRNC